jgi:chromosomal replication initiator protein
VSAELEHIWSRVLAQLGQTVDDSTYRIWIEPLRAVELGGDRLVVEAPRRTAAWVGDRFGRLLQRSVAAVLGPHVTLDLVGARDPGPAGRGWRDQHSPETRADPPHSSGARVPHGDLPVLPVVHEPTLNPKLSFEQFVIGDSNRLAHAAALAVAEMPSQAYNPLFLYGPPGLGKTHLLHSIATFLAHHAGGLSVRYTTGEAFTNEFLAALRAGELERFKQRFRRVDVLLIDDIQFLERKTRTEEEFFHTFNALSDLGSQIVVTSDRLPRDLDALEDRLRERFEAGLVADIRPPDLPTRLGVLRKRVHHDRVPLAEADALDVIAQRITLNIRALEGALIRVVAYASLTGRPLTTALARDVIDGLYPATRRDRRSVADIQAAVCRHFHVSAQELVSTSRAARVSWPRQVAMYVARELTADSLPTIGRQFGGRDHTTVLHACRRTARRIQTDAQARAAVEALLTHLRGEGS